MSDIVNYKTSYIVNYKTTREDTHVLRTAMRIFMTFLLLATTWVIFGEFVVAMLGSTTERICIMILLPFTSFLLYVIVNTWEANAEHSNEEF